MTRTRRSLSVTFGFEEEEAVAFDERLDTFQNVYWKGTKSRNELLQWLMEFSIRFHWNRIKQGLGPTSDEMPQIEGLPNYAIINDMLNNQRKKQMQINQLIDLYESLGLDAFVEACEQWGIDWQSVLLDKYTFQSRSTLSWAETAKRTLDVWFQNGEAIKTSEVKQRAINEKLLDGDETQIEMGWNKLKVLAHRHGFSGAADYGYWKKPY